MDKNIGCNQVNKFLDFVSCTCSCPTKTIYGQCSWNAL